jgi:adenylate cyclase
MWTFIVYSADTKPSEYRLKPGVTTLGRRQGSDIWIADEAASREHAEVAYAEDSDSLAVRDLGSRNGTYLNRMRLIHNREYKLNPEDRLRIGSYEILVKQVSEMDPAEQPPSGLQPYSRELLIESFDNHAVILYEVIQQLNTILDINVAMKEVAKLLQKTLGADKCQVIMAEDFGRLKELGFPRTIAQTAIERRSTVLFPSQEAETKQLLSESAKFLRVRTALCVPVIQEEKVIALIYMYKTRADTKHFGQRDLQLAVAISHLAKLTIERVNLMEKAREENRVRQLLKRLVAPTEAEFLLRNYLKSGSMPELTEQRCTILFADIAGSMGIAERLGAKKFGELLERFYQDVTDIVFQYGGLLVNYLGDGVMAVFGMTGSQRQRETKAVAAGLELLDLVNARYRSGENRIDIGIGINTGNVVAGYISTRERMELTVLGDTVNVASGLQALARPNRLFIGPETYREVKRQFTVKTQGSVTIKDRSQPIEVYEVTKLDSAALPS